MLLSGGRWRCVPGRSRYLPLGIRRKSSRRRSSRGRPLAGCRSCWRGAARWLSAGSRWSHLQTHQEWAGLSTSLNNRWSFPTTSDSPSSSVAPQPEIQHMLPSSNSSPWLGRQIGSTKPEEQEEEQEDEWEEDILRGEHLLLNYIPQGSRRQDLYWTKKQSVLQRAPAVMR